MSKWHPITLGESCDILDNQRIPVNSIGRAEIEGEIPYYGANGVQGYVNDFIFNEPLILIAEDGGYFDEYQTRPIAYRIHGKSWVNNHAHVLRAKPKYNQDFIFYSLQHINITPFIKGGTRAKLNQAELKQVEFLCPEFQKEQAAIANVLEAVHVAIENTKALIAKYQQIRAGLMHDLFTRGVTADGNLRPPREQAPELYQATPIGWIPKEWDCRKLGKILHESGGYLQTGPFGSQLHAHEYTHDGIPVVMPQDIDDGKIFTHAIARIPESRAKFLARHRVKLGDIIIARRGELSRAAAISQGEIGWVCGTGCFLLRLSGSRLDPQFFSYAYRHDIIQRQIEGLAVGSTMPSLNNSVMNSLYFPYLSKDEQHRISERLETQDVALLLLVREKEKLVKQKHGLMHDLLTGEVRVKPITVPA